MEFKVFKSDNATFLRIKLDIMYSDLERMYNLTDLTAYDKDTEKPIFTVHNSSSVQVSPKGLAVPMSSEDKKIDITVQIAQNDELSTRYYVATIKEGMNKFVDRFNKEKKRIEDLANSVEVE